MEKSHPLRGVDFHISKGEIVGLAGVSGNGQNELVECLVGLRESDGGSVSLAGEDITRLLQPAKTRAGRRLHQRRPET